MIESVRNYFMTECGGGRCIQVCPCGCKNVHLRGINIYCRKEDDKIKLYHIHMENGLEQLLDDFPERSSPSPRRNSIDLLFECEDGCEFSLIIAQHKGDNVIRGKGKFKFTDDVIEYD
jgi:hypothetical protein